MNYEQVYQCWLSQANLPDDIKEELLLIKNQPEQIRDRFYRDLEFGTGGLRGIIGAGTNRMNVYTVAKAAQGYSNYLNARSHCPSVAIAYDSRNKSHLFAKISAQVFSANGIHVYLYSDLMPTPALSFAVRYLKCSGGIVITASHNPAQYNGFKVYGSDGGQITLEAASGILNQIKRIDTFNDINYTDFQDAIEKRRISYITEDVKTAYLHAVSLHSLIPSSICRDFSIVYTPLNGAGISCVPRCLAENGFSNVLIPPAQREPDGNFPTCPYPNPETKDALSIGLAYAQTNQSDLLLATDPDCDRIGTAIRHKKDYYLINGNQMGILLLDFICKMRKINGSMPLNPVAIKTIVTTPMAKKIAAYYGVELLDTLTGFKFIGEQIGLLEKNGQVERFIFGFEESYGYLSGSFVRDKDAVNAALLICEMFAYYREKNRSLLDVLDQLYRQYGAYSESLLTYTFEGEQGVIKIQKMMDIIRDRPPRKILGAPVFSVSDYQRTVTTFTDGRSKKINLPKSNVITIHLADAELTIRPSGTEPKLKIYLSANAARLSDSKEMNQRLEVYCNNWIASFGG